MTKLISDKKTLFVILGGEPMPADGTVQKILYCHHKVVLNLAADFPLIVIENPSFRGNVFKSYKGIQIFKPIFSSRPGVDLFSSEILMTQVKARIQVEVKKLGAERVVFLGYCAFFKAKLNIGVEEIHISLFGDLFFPFINTNLSHLDKVLCVNHGVFTFAKELFADKAEFYPMFVDDDWLKLHQSSPETKKLCYFGNLSFERIDIMLLVSLVDDLKDYEFDFYGNFHMEYDELLFRKLLGCKSNVRYLGSYTPETFLEKARNYKYGLIPYLRTAFNLGCSPTKLFEYLSIGLEVISPDLFYEKDVIPLIHLYRSVSDIKETIMKSKRRNSKEKSLKFLEKYTTSYRTKQILDVLRNR